MEYYKYFRERYTGISSVQQRWADEVLQSESSRLRTVWGLEYFYPHTRLKNDGTVTNFTNICNYPVQGLATAEIIPIAVVYFWHRTRGTGISLVNTIHDSILATFQREKAALFTDIAKCSLIEDVYDYLRRVYGIRFTIPLGAGIKVSSHWSEGEEVKYEAAEELWATP
jgi:hypothetical protein